MLKGISAVNRGQIFLIVVVIVIMATVLQFNQLLSRHYHFNSVLHLPDLYEAAVARMNSVRVLCLVITCPSNHEKKAVHILATWGRRCNKILFVSEKSDNETTLPLLQVASAGGRSRDQLPRKVAQAFDHVYANYSNDFDWFLKTDDDTYVIVENLRHFLSEQNPDEPVYFGHHFKAKVEQGYFSGGAGYVLSREALRRFVNRPRAVCKLRLGGAEDSAIGSCMETVGVKTGDARDCNGRSRFHPFPPLAHINGIFPERYLSFDKYGAPWGINSISEYSVSFHYITPPMLYQLEFFVYHLRPFGLSLRADTNVRNLN